VINRRSHRPPTTVILSPQAKNLSLDRETAEPTTPLRQEVLHFVQDDGVFR